MTRCLKKNEMTTANNTTNIPEWVQSNNVVDLNLYRSSKVKKPSGDTTSLDEFIDNYSEATAVVSLLLPSIIGVFEQNGIDITSFNESDAVLLRESLVSMVMRYRQAFHPLQPYAEDFDKYFEKLVIVINKRSEQDDDNN